MEGIVVDKIDSIRQLKISIWAQIFTKQDVSPGFLFIIGLILGHETIERCLFGRFDCVKGFFIWYNIVFRKLVFYLWQFGGRPFMKSHNSWKEPFGRRELFIDCTHFLSVFIYIRDVVLGLPRSQLAWVPVHKACNHELSFHEFNLFITFTSQNPSNQFHLSLSINHFNLIPQILFLQSFFLYF